MSYYLISDFQAGLDVRKSSLTAPAGTLRRCINAHVTRGGEIERRKGFVEVGDFDPDTFGLHTVEDQLYTFGASPDMARPPGVNYQQLTAGNDSPLRRLLSTTNFEGAIYAIGEFQDGNVLHFYDGQQVNAWVDLADELGSLPAVARTVASQIELLTSAQAEAEGDEIAITAPFPGQTVDVTAGSNVTVVGVDQEATDELPQVTRIRLSTDYLPDVTYAVTVYGQYIPVLGRAAGYGRVALTHQNRVFSIAQSLLRYSGYPGVDPSAADFDIQEAVSGPDPTIWDPVDADGNRTYAGAINLSTQSGGSEQLTGIAVYQDLLAVFSDQTTHIWSVDSINPIGMAQVQVMPNLGTSSPRSLQTFGEADVFFLGQSGVRSLRARDSSNYASVADVGTPIDDEIREFLAERNEQVRRDAVSAIEPREGRYWLAVDNRIYVLSRFPGSRITAWSVYELPDAITDIAVTAKRTYVRAGNRLYLYGGVTGGQRDEAPAEVLTPFSGADDPARLKQITSFDIACEGRWQLFIRPDPTLPDYEEYLGEIDGTTLGLQGSHPALAQTTHVAFRMVSIGDGYHRLGSIVYHYQRLGAA